MLATFPGHQGGCICYTDFAEVIEIRQVDNNSNVLLVLAEQWCLLLRAQCLPACMALMPGILLAELLSLKDYYSTLSSCPVPWFA